jgi:hypothetical protein
MWEIYSTAVKKGGNVFLLCSCQVTDIATFCVCAESSVTKATLSIARKTSLSKGLDFLIYNYFLLRTAVQVELLLPFVTS